MSYPAAPRIIFNNLWRGTGNQTIDLVSRPQVFVTKTHMERKTNRVETGASQTLFYHRREILNMEFSFLRSEKPSASASDLSALLELWESTPAREPFTLYVHRDYPTNYPTGTSLYIRQPLTVRWAEGFDDLDKVRTENVANLVSLKLQMECEDGSFFAFS